VPNSPADALDPSNALKSLGRVSDHKSVPIWPDHKTCQAIAASFRIVAKLFGTRDCHLSTPALLSKCVIWVAPVIWAEMRLKLLYPGPTSKILSAFKPLRYLLSNCSIIVRSVFFMFAAASPPASHSPFSASTPPYVSHESAFIIMSWRSCNHDRPLSGNKMKIKK